MDEKRKPGWVFWTIVTLIVLALYPLSIGPAFWINERTDAGTNFIAKVYVPFLDALPPGGFIERVVNWYIFLGVRDDPLLIWKGNGIFVWARSERNTVLTPHQAANVEFMTLQKAANDTINAEKTH